MGQGLVEGRWEFVGLLDGPGGDAVGPAQRREIGAFELDAVVAAGAVRPVLAVICVVTGSVLAWKAMRRMKAA